MSKKPSDQSGPRRDQRRGPTVSEVKPGEGKAATPAAPVPAKPTDATPAAAGLAGVKPVDSKPVDAKPVDAKPVGSTPADAELPGAGPADSKLVDPGPVPSRPAGPEPVDSKPLDAPRAGMTPAARAADPAKADAPSSTEARTASEAAGSTVEPVTAAAASPPVEPVVAEPSTLAPGPGETRRTEPLASVPPSGPRAGPSEPPPARPSAHTPVLSRPAETPRGGAGFGSLLAASVIGGLVGAGLTAAYLTYQASEADAALAGRLGQVESRVAALPPLQPLEQRVGQVEGAQRSSQAALDETRQIAERSAATARQALDKPPPATTPASEANARAIEAARQSIDDVTKRVGALDGEVKAAGEATKTLDRRIAEQEKALSGAVQRASEQSTRAAQALQRVAAAERIADAVRTGAPFAPALEALRRSGADAARLDALKPFAETGAPTGTALADEFRPVAESLAAAAAVPPTERGAPRPEGGGDWTGGLMRLADRIVTVRPAGEAAPDELKVALDRVASALRAGDLRGAQGAYDALPASAKQASAAFGERLRTRVAADEAARALAGDAIAALDAPAR